MAPGPVLTVEGVGHAWGPTTVLEDIGFTVAAGETLALVGPSGCGKTTLLHLVAGLTTCAEGRIDNGFASTACVFQQPRLLPWKTARANVALGLTAQGLGRGPRRERAAAMALRLGLAAADLGKFPHELSGGMQSRVALARALVLDPLLLLLDEPFSALDIGLKTELYGLLTAQQARLGSAALMITHDLMEAVRLSDSVLVMQADPGRLVYRMTLQQPHAARDERWIHATAAELLQQPAVRRAFGLPS